MATVLVTGANRGLGLEFSRQYADAGWRVLACCRRPADAAALGALASASHGRVTLHTVAVDRQDSVDALAAELGQAPIDVLINGAGLSLGPESSYQTVDFDRWEEAFRVNTLGPMRVTRALLELVTGSQRRTIVMITSDMGSIGGNEQGYAYEYRTSKAALNALTRNLDIELRSRGVIVVALHPGWVNTDMGGPQAPVGVEESIAGLRRVIESLTAERSGRYYNFEGRELPW